MKTATSISIQADKGFASAIEKMEAQLKLMKVAANLCKKIPATDNIRQGYHYAKPFISVFMHKGPIISVSFTEFKKSGTKFSVIIDEDYLDSFIELGLGVREGKSGKKDANSCTFTTYDVEEFILMANFGEVK